MFDKLIDFIQKYAPHYTDREKIREVILGHLKYGTIDFEIDNDGEFIFACRWNIKDNTAYVLDLIINEKYQRRKIIKWVLAKNLMRFPWVHFLVWERRIKYPERKPKIYSVKKFLKFKEVKRNGWR